MSLRTENKKLAVENKKRCTSCKEIKSFDDYHIRNPKKSDTLRANCKICRKIYNARIYRERKEKKKQAQLQKDEKTK